MKAKLAILLSFLFISLLITPVISSLIDNNQEITSLHDSKDEENKNEELEKDIEIELRTFSKNTLLEIFYEDDKDVTSFNDSYYLELTKKNTPPPELNS